MNRITRSDRKKSILYVEDEIIIAMEKALAIEKHGYAVSTVASGEKAIKAMKNGHGIDLIIMDIDLGPGLNGAETAEIILKEHDVPVIFLSSYTVAEIAEKTKELVSCGYITKNSCDMELIASIKAALELY